MYNVMYVQYNRIITSMLGHGGSGAFGIDFDPVDCEVAIPLYQSTHSSPAIVGSIYSVDWTTGLGYWTHV